MGTFFFAGNESVQQTNRYQVLDQVVVSRGLLADTGLRLDLESVAICSSLRYLPSDVCHALIDPE